VVPFATVLQKSIASWTCANGAMATWRDAGQEGQVEEEELEDVPGTGSGAASGAGSGDGSAQAMATAMAISMEREKRMITAQD
jgi:hypothetical protein